MSYTHTDIMQAIIAIVYMYIVMGEFKGRLVHCPALQGVPFGRNISERTRMECVTITVSAL